MVHAINVSPVDFSFSVKLLSIFNILPPMIGTESQMLLIRSCLVSANLSDDIRLLVTVMKVGEVFFDLLPVIHTLRYFAPWSIDGVEIRSFNMLPDRPIRTSSLGGCNERAG